MREELGTVLLGQLCAERVDGDDESAAVCFKLQGQCIGEEREMDVLLKQAPTRKGQAVSHTRKVQEFQNCRSPDHPCIPVIFNCQSESMLGSGPSRHRADIIEAE